jgi:hypothetical protein
VATARFKGGAIREKVDITGVVPALMRNFSNDCEYYKNKLFESSLIRELKRWAMEDINAKKADIGDYPIERELQDISIIADKKNEGIGVISETEEDNPFIGDEEEGYDGVSECFTDSGEGDSLRDEYDPDGDEEVQDAGDFSEGTEDSSDSTESGEVKDSDSGTGDRQD